MQKFMTLEPILEKACTELNRFYWNERELNIYEEAEKKEKNYSLDQKFDKGRENARAEGKVEGTAEVAQTLLKLGYDLQQIPEMTGLNIQEIEQLILQNKVL